MDVKIKRIVLEHRIAGLKAHIEHVGGGTASPGFARALEKAENELRALEQPQSG